MSVFCREHAFYDCPICRGEELVWTIPVYTGSEKTGELKLYPAGNVEILGHVNLPGAGQEGEPLYTPPSKPVTLILPSPPEPINPLLADTLRAQLLPSPLAAMMVEPKWRAAAARGLKVHQRALELVEERELDYNEAIQEVLSE